MPRTLQEAFSFRGLLWLPHYWTKGAFIGPGRYATRYYTRDQLISLGAKPVEVLLWARPYNE